MFEVHRHSQTKVGISVNAEGVREQSDVPLLSNGGGGVEISRKMCFPLVLREIWFTSVASSTSPPFLASLTKATTTLSKQVQIRRTIAQMKANTHVH